MPTWAGTFVFLLSVVLPATGGHAQNLFPHGTLEEPEHYFDLSLEELLEVNVKEDEPGWFGTQLEQLAVKPYVHGYAVADYRDFDFDHGREIGTFDLHYFNVVVGARLGKKVAAEMLLEYEHGGDEIGVRYGIIDYKIRDWAILRLGKFLTPVGRFNEYLSPEYANKLPDRPYCLWRIVPIVWAETGVQLRGQHKLPADRSINYAFYVVNGLEQPANDDGSVAQGGDIRDMRPNNRDSSSHQKAFGGRIGYKPCRDLEVGASYYTGAYTIDGEQNLSILDFDVEYRREDLTVRGEYVRAVEDTTGDDLIKDGFYAEAAYRVDRYLEPVIRYDQANLDDGSGHDIQRSTVGLVFYPMPDEDPLFNFKVSQSFIHDDGTGHQQSEFVLQCVIGF